MAKRSDGTVARVWQADGGILGQPGAAEELFSRALDRSDLPTFRAGTVYLVNRVQSRALGVRFSQDGAFPDIDVVRGRIHDLLGCFRDETHGGGTGPMSEEEVLSGPWTYEVVYARFSRIPGKPRIRTVDHPLARVTAVEGGSITDDGVIDVIAAHTADALNMSGCLGSALLVDRDRTAILGLSFWLDARSADRMATLAAETASSITSLTGAHVTDTGIYDVIYIDPLERLVL